MVLHAMSMDGFIPGCREVFDSKSDSQDYHKEMNAQHFEEWLDKLIANIPRNSKGVVLVMDNASYHSRKLTKPPTSATKKLELQEWLTSNEIDYLTSDTVVKLYNRVKAVKKQFPCTYAADEKLRAAGIEVLRLPPYHCQFNPIELVWAKFKNRVCKENTEMKVDTIKAP